MSNDVFLKYGIIINVKNKERERERAGYHTHFMIVKVTLRKEIKRQLLCKMNVNSFIQHITNTLNIQTR